MESQVSPKNIEARVEAMAAADKAAADAAAKPEVKAEEKQEVKADEKPEVKSEEKPEVKAEVKPEAKVEVKPEVKVEAKPEKKAPNDPAELRKWNTKLSQELAANREETRALKAAIEKLSKKPVDYAELAKNPDGLKAHIEAERQEAVRELQQQLTEKNTLAVKNETMYERSLRERDTENYPRWNKLFPLIQTLASNGDGRVNWNQAPGAALDEAYALADQLSPSEAPAVVVPKEEPKVEEKVVTGKTQAEIDAEVAAKVAEAEERGFKKAQEALRAEQAGGGIGSAGKGGRRDNSVSKEAFKTMPLKDLKAFISKE